jgi:hypothetical protein
VYRDELGVGYHDPVLRAKFLFNSPNAKNISSDEREQLNLILRSVEENAPLDIDISKMEIIFPSFTVTEQRMPSKPALDSHRSLSLTPIGGGNDSRVDGDNHEIGIVASQTPRDDGNGSFSQATVPAPKPNTEMQPTPAPKRQGMFSSAFTIRPTTNGAQAQATSTTTVPTPPANQGGFRVGKGMHFTSLESKPSAPTPSIAPAPPVPVVPSPPVQPRPAEGGFSFSSKHSFQAERPEEGGLSINRPSGKALPSGQVFFKSGAASSVPATPTPPKPAAPKMNPFQIRPVSLHGKSGDEDMGRIVDLRNE